jgi:hypothetical protein
MNPLRPDSRCPDPLNFIRVFYQNLGRLEFPRGDFSHFYENIFPKSQRITQQ